MSALLATAFAIAAGLAPPPFPAAELPMVEYHLGDVTCLAHPRVVGLVCLTS
jgi:hypothetical protein